MFLHKVNENLSLKILELRHANDHFKLIDQDRIYLREWLPWVDNSTSVEHSQNFINFSLKAFSENNGFTLGIYYDNQFAGCIGLHGIDWANKKTTIGYWLGKDFQGLGIMTCACKAVIKYLFDELSINRVEIRAASDNLKSRAIPERLKFVNEGTVRQAEWLYGKKVDHVIYGMLKEDWTF